MFTASAQDRRRDQAHDLPIPTPEERQLPVRKLLAPIALTAALSGGAGAIIFGPALAGAQTDEAPAAAETPAADEVMRHRPFADILKGLVEDGTLTQAQADKVAAAIKEARPFKGGPGRHHVKLGAAIDGVAEILGITEADLKAQLRDGKTLAEIAGDKSDELIDALVAKSAARIDEAVANDKLTAEQGTALKAKLEARITTMVEEGPKLRPRDGGRGAHFRGGPPELDGLEESDTDA